MDPNEFPTKGNLIRAKDTLATSKMGYDLLDKKRNVLIREIFELNNVAAEIQAEIEVTFAEAYEALQDANIMMGLSNVRSFGFGMPVEESVKVKARSIMGVEIPLLQYDQKPTVPYYGFINTTTSFDDAVIKFNKVKDLTLRLSYVENAAYRLAETIKKTQRRANALKNVTIPKYENLTKFITNTLEEKERDDFTRLKVIKKQK